MRPRSRIDWALLGFIWRGYGSRFTTWLVNNSKASTITHGQTLRARSIEAWPLFDTTEVRAAPSAAAAAANAGKPFPLNKFNAR